MKKAIRYLVITAGICLAFALAVGLGGCSEEGETQMAEMNTIQAYKLSEAEADIIDLAGAGNRWTEIVQFTADEYYGHLDVGCDVYEKGRLTEAQPFQTTGVNFEYENGPQTTYGRIGISADSTGVAITIKHGGKAFEENNGGSFKSTKTLFNDTDMQTVAALQEPVSIEAGKKVYFWAVMATGDDNIQGISIEQMQEDKTAFAKYDKCYMYYAKFKK